MQSMGDKLVEQGQNIISQILAFVKLFMDKIVVPLGLIGLGIGLFFAIISYARAKNAHSGEDLEDKTRMIIILLLLFIAVGAYGTIFGNLISGLGG